MENNIAETKSVPESSKTMDLTRMSDLKRLLGRHGMVLSKRFGQNFLVSRTHLMKVVETANVQPGDWVFEIGPGAGTLTVELAQRADKVVAVELDRMVIPILAETLNGFTNVEVMQTDALRLDLPNFFADHFGNSDGFGNPTKKIKVVANIPYNITSPLLTHLLVSKHLISSITLMVQKEVAKRLIAPPNSDDYSSLSVFAQFHTIVTMTATVPRAAFFPPPKVDSAVVHFVPHSVPPVEIITEAAFVAVSRASFGQRRKTLFNALTNAPQLSFTKEQIADVLRNAEIDGNRRGETLTLDEIARISRFLPTEGLDHNAESD